jgi:hypothetical protein
MSPRQGRANPFKKIRLKITLEADRPSLERVSKAVRRPRVTGNKLISESESSDPGEAIAEITRLGESAREKPKDFK